MGELKNELKVSPIFFALPKIDATVELLFSLFFMTEATLLGSVKQI